MDADNNRIQAVTRHLTPLVRPDDLLSAMARITSGFMPVDPLITRLGQGVLDDSGRVVEPF
jgi:uncharacterized protein (DUF1786 family)